MVMAYIDDIVIATETVEDHVVRLREVFECLREAGFKMRAAKCNFMKSEIKYMGRIVSAGGVELGPKAVEKQRDWEIPHNKTEMQSFLGFAYYYREFIPGMLNWLLFCTPSPASVPRLHGDLSSNSLSTNSKRHSLVLLILHSLIVKASSC